MNREKFYLPDSGQSEGEMKEKKCEEVECPKCGGRGREPRGHKLLRKSGPCTACGGTGRKLISMPEEKK